MTKGINRAYPRGIFETQSVSETCVFISHKYEDLKAAQKVAGYIMAYGIDVYLDDRDFKLKKAIDEHNSRGIVSCIETGINSSTHILVLVTENTRKSWWVPYETGYAKKGTKGIASLLLKEADEFPDYLKIETTLKGFDDLTTFLDKLPRLNPIPESATLKQERILARNNYRNSLLEYIRK